MAWILNNFWKKSTDSEIESPDVIAAPESTNMKVKELTVQSREYSYYKLHSALELNVETYNERTNEKVSKMHIHLMSQIEEYDILFKSESVFEYNQLISQKIANIHEYTSKNKIFDNSKKRKTVFQRSYGEKKNECCSTFSENILAVEFTEDESEDEQDTIDDGSRKKRFKPELSYSPKILSDFIVSKNISLCTKNSSIENAKYSTKNLENTNCSNSGEILLTNLEKKTKSSEEILTHSSLPKTVFEQSLKMETNNQLKPEIFRNSSQTTNIELSVKSLALSSATYCIDFSGENICNHDLNNESSSNSIEKEKLAGKISSKNSPLPKKSSCLTGITSEKIEMADQPENLKIITNVCDSTATIKILNNEPEVTQIDNSDSNGVQNNSEKEYGANIIKKIKDFQNDSGIMDIRDVEITEHNISKLKNPQNTSEVTDQNSELDVQNDSEKEDGTNTRIKITDSNMLNSTNFQNNSEIMDKRDVEMTNHSISKLKNPQNTSDVTHQSTPKDQNSEPPAKIIISTPDTVDKIPIDMQCTDKRFEFSLKLVNISDTADKIETENSQNPVNMKNATKISDLSSENENPCYKTDIFYIKNPTKYEKQTFKILKPLVKEHIKKFSFNNFEEKNKIYRQIFRRLHVDIMKRKLINEEEIVAFAKDAFHSQKNLPEK